MLYGSLTAKDNEKISYLYGRAAKGFYIAGDTRNVLKDGEMIAEVNDENQLINPEISRYIFFPEGHRLFVERKNNGPSVKDIENHLNATLGRFIGEEEQLEIVLEKDDSTIQEIFDAKVVHSISYRVSYTNEDFLGDLAESFDEHLKKNNIGTLSVTAKADNHLEGLKIEDSELLGGGLRLAESNGEIKSAEITPQAGGSKRRRISNTNKPKVLSLKIEDQDDFWVKWYKFVQKLYRNG